MPSAPMRRRAAIRVGMALPVELQDESETTGQDDRLKPSGSSSPFSIEETVVLEKRGVGPSRPSSDIRVSSPRVRFEFSVMVAILRRGAL